VKIAVTPPLSHRNLTQQCCWALMSQHCQVCFACCVTRSGACCHRAVQGCITLAVCTSPLPVVTVGTILSEHVHVTKYVYIHSNQRLRRLGHVARMPRKLLFGDFKGLCPPGRTRSRFNDVAGPDCQKCCVSKPYRDAPNRLLWRDKSCPVRTWLIISQKAFMLLRLLRSWSALCLCLRHFIGTCP